MIPYKPFIRKVIITLFFLTFIFLGFSVKAQDWKRTQNWYFGDSAGLSFATNPPTALTDGKMYALEGCATISDTAGNLLFYTNGRTIWNRNHQVMLNGDSLSVYYSSAQPALIIPQPGSDSIYFVLTTGGDGFLTFDLHYSVVNIKRDNGLGEVTRRDEFLLKNSTEKLAATYHSNSQDIWVATHELNSNRLYTFLVTKEGIIHCPIVSEVGSFMTGAANQTEMRFSHSGELACVSFWSDGFVELLNFDNQTGKFSNPIKITTSPGWVSGIAFSNDDRKLLMSARWRWIRSYSLDVLTASAISSSMQTLYTDGNSRVNGQFANIRENGVLFNWFGSNYLGKITFEPNGTTSFTDSAVSIAPRTGTYGMPQFISSYLENWRIDFSYSNNCLGHYTFEAKDTIQANHYQWKILRNQVEQATFSGKILSHTFSDTGIWQVRLLVSNGTLTDSLEKTIFVQIRRGIIEDRLECADSVVLDAGQGHCYLWSDGSMDRYLKVKQSGTYGVRIITDYFCTVYDTVAVTLDRHPVTVPISRDGDTLKTAIGFKKYQWYRDGQVLEDDTLSSLKLTQRGTYKVWAVDGGNCSDFSELLVVDTLTSFFEILPEQSIYIYPNPSRAEAGVFVKSGEPLEQVVLYSVEGRVIRQAQPHTTEWHTGELPKGVYLIVINQMYHQKIIIH